MTEDLTGYERTHMVQVDKIHYEAGKLIWLTKKSDIFKVAQILQKPVLFLKEGSFFHLGVPTSDKKYSVLAVIDGDRCYMFALKGVKNGKEKDIGDD